jgi:hypothetical protein
MLHFDIGLHSAVADLTRQVRRRFAIQFVGQEFKQGQYAFRVEVLPEVFEHFVVNLTHINEFGKGSRVLITEVHFDDPEAESVMLFASTLTLTRKMTVLSAIQCSAHLIGDYVKTAFTQAVESETDFDN